MTMEYAMHRRLRSVVVVLTLALTSPVFGYEYPLSSEAIREAYFLGSARGTKAAHFIEQYTHHFSVPPNGPYVAMIQLETPYAQIVERAQKAINYNPPDAVQEFLGKTGVFHLRIQIYFTPSYTAMGETKDGKLVLRADEFWRDFKVRFVQGGEIRADRVQGQALYGGYGTRQRIGAEVELDYNAEEIKSEPAKIEVITPEGGRIETTFDLARLR